MRDQAIEEEAPNKVDSDASKPLPSSSEISKAAEAAAQNVNQIASFSDQLSAQLRKHLERSTNSWDQIRLGLEKHSEALKELNQLYSRGLGGVAEEIAAQQSDMQSAFSSLSKIPMRDFVQQMNATNAQFAQTLSSLSIDLARAFEGVDISALEVALGHELEQRTEDLEETTTEQTVSAFIIELYVAVHNRLPAGTISREAILMMILSVVLTVYQVESSSKDTQRIVEELQEVQRVIQKEHSTSNKRPLPDSDEQTFIATTTLNLRTHPSTDAPKEMEIGYNQEVEVIKREGDWAYVNFHDDVEDIPRSGWVHTDYLKRAI